MLPELDDSLQTDAVSARTAVAAPLWVTRSRLLWAHRLLLSRIAGIALVLSLGVVFLIPKQYTATARIMPPDQQGSGALMMAALAGRGGGGLGALSGLAGDLLGGHTTTALFIDLLRSGTVTGQIIDRFSLQQLYRNRYRVDTAKTLARRTSILDDKKSGVITITVEDTDPARARDMVAAYLDGLNRIVTHTATSSARQERLFVEHRLQQVKVDLQAAQVRLSDFSTQHSTIDIREQTHAMVDAGARVQGELLAEQAGLQSLRQVYGDGNVRLRASQARITSLQQDLQKLAGTGKPNTAESGNTGELYPPLRQLPALGVPYANLVREIRVQEAIYELLTQQYELARLEEAKDVPVVKVIDPPGLPEKKSFPPRLWVSLGLTALTLGVSVLVLILLDLWRSISPDDPARVFVAEVLDTLRRRAAGALAAINPRGVRT